MNENTQSESLQHLAGPWWWASRKRFVQPGLFFLSLRFGQFRVLPLPPLVSEPALIEFAEQTIVIAKDQPQYRPLPAHRRPNSEQGEIVCCWKLSLPARIKLLWTGVLWHSIWTFNGPLQPQLLLHTKPDMERR